MYNSLVNRLIQITRPTSLVEVKMFSHEMVNDPV